MRITPITACLVAVVLALPASLHAQQGDTGPGDQPGVAVQSHDVEAARDRLHLLLLRPDVRQTARDRGIDLRPIHEGVETLGPAALAQVAPYADQVEAEEAQSAITITTTAIIIGLLVIILLVMIT
jgi:hypothetical protein